MSDRDVEQFATWLEAEGVGDLDEADARFSVLYSRFVPPLEAPAGFRGRVLAAVAARRRRFDPGLARWSKVLVAAGVGTIGAALAVAPVGGVLEFCARAAGAAVRGWHAATTMLTAALGLALHSLGVMTDLASATAVVMTTRSGLIVIALNLLLAAVSFAGLKRLLAPREEFSR